MTHRDEPNETTEMWRAVRHAKQDRLARRRERGTSEIAGLTQAGYAVRTLTEFQFRVNEAVDLFPTNRRYHDLRSNKRGTYRNETAEELLGRLRVR